MLELLILFVLGRNLGVNARAKGRTAIGYQFLLVFLWFAGEVAGGIAGLLLLLLFYGEEAREVWFLAYPLMIAGAALGAWGVFFLVKSLPDQRDAEDADLYRDSNIELS